MWMQFKKYMKSYKTDFIKEEIDEDNSDVSLIYALGLDIRKSLKDFMLDKSDTASEIYSYDGWIFWYFFYINTSNNSFRRSLNKSFGSSAGESSSSSSGGSFSGGGGGGAGGGGAGGF
jgi:uncharacterized membrane protein